MNRPQEIDTIIEKLETLVEGFGLHGKIKDHILPYDFDKLMEYIRKLEKGY